MKIFDEGAETFFALSEGVNGGALLGDIADDDQGAAAAIEFEEGAGELAGAKLAGFGLERELDVADFGAFAELRENVGAQAGFCPEIKLERSFAEDFLAGIARKASEPFVDVLR